MSGDDILAMIVVTLLFYAKKRYYRFIEKKFPEVDWDYEED